MSASEWTRKRHCGDLSTDLNVCSDGFVIERVFLTVKERAALESELHEFL